MNNRHIPTLIELLIACTLAACAPTPSPVPTTTATITATAANTTQPTSTINPTPTPITYPMRLEQVGQFGGIADALALSGDRVYLQVDKRLLTIDVSNPYRPTVIGRSEILATRVPYVIVSTDGHVLAGDAEGALLEFEELPDGNLALLHTYSKDDAARPRISVPSEAAAQGGGYLFEYYPGWKAYPMVAEAQPLTVRKQDGHDEVITAIGSLPTGETAVSQSIAARGRYVYVAVGYGLSIYDIGVNPNRPYALTEAEGWRKTMWKEIGTLTTSTSYYITSLSDGMAPYIPDACVFGNYLYTDSGAWSLENPEDPVNVPKLAGSLPDCHGFSVEGGMIDANINNGAYTFLDMSDPNQYTTRRIAAGIEGDRIFAVGSDLLFASSIYKDEDEGYILYILDIADLWHPRLLSSYPIQGHPAYDSAILIGSYLYMNLFGSDSVVVLDVSDPANPQRMSAPADFSPDWTQTFVHSNWIFKTENNQLFTFSFDDILTPVSVLTFPEAIEFPPQHGDPLHSSGKLYIYNEDRELTVVDIQNPAHPHPLAKTLHDYGYYYGGIASYGDYLYLTGMGGGVDIYKLVPN